VTTQELIALLEGLSDHQLAAVARKNVQLGDADLANLALNILCARDMPSVSPKAVI
jgi:hypothetical protein